MTEQDLVATIGLLRCWQGRLLRAESAEICGAEVVLVHREDYERLVRDISACADALLTAIPPRPVIVLESADGN